MSSRLVVRPQAAAELLAAGQWFDGQRPGLGREFGVEVDLTISEVLTRPDTFPQVHAIVILGIIHGHRDPESWRQRR